MGQGVELGVEVGSVRRLRLKEILDVPCHDREHRASRSVGREGCSVECGVKPAEAVVFAAWIAGPAYECTVLSARRGLAVLLSAEDCPLRVTAATLCAVEVSLGGPLERWCA